MKSTQIKIMYIIAINLNVVSPFQNLYCIIVNNSKPGALGTSLRLGVFITELIVLFYLRAVTRRPTHLTDGSVGFILVAGLIDLSDSIEVVISSNYALRVHP